MAELKLKVDDLTVSFKTNQGLVRAVRGVSFDLYKGETLAIVGESGSGKSVSSRAIMGILAGNGMIDKGSIIYEGEDLTQVDEEHFHEIRGNRIGMIFQDPMSSLNPIMRIGKQITEGMLLNGKHLDNRYKALFQETRGRYNSLKRMLKRAKKRGKILKTKYNWDKSELTRQYERMMNEEAETEQDVLNLKEELAVKQQELLNNFNKTLEVELPKAKEEIAKIKQELPEAKRKMKAQKAEAKKTVTKEWKDAQAQARQDLAVLQQEKAKAIQEAKASGLAKEELKAVETEWKTKIDDRKEALARFKKVTKREAFERAVEVMREVGIDNPEKRYKQYPFQFSGGMRQRIVIAIALTADPELLICDEPTTALDVTIQAQILELINKLKESRNLSVIFITHDLGVVANMADRIGVMYAGKIVELGTAEDVFYSPRHPYTWALLSSMPDLDSKERLTAIPGTPPNMLFPPKGDAFAERNKYAMRIDFEEQPPMFKISDTHYAATWLLHKDAPKVEMPDAVKHRIERMLKHSETSEVTEA
jgi:oligopeptide transport system ATP-binding protein